MAIKYLKYIFLHSCKVGIARNHALVRLNSVFYISTTLTNSQRQTMRYYVHDEVDGTNVEYQVRILPLGITFEIWK